MAIPPTVTSVEESLGAANADVEATLSDWRTGDLVARLWRGDATLWTGRDEAHWLGWLHLAHADAALAPPPFTDLAAEVRAAGFRHAVLLGMGGSSLCPDVLSKAFAHREGFPSLAILDSVVPAQIRSLERRVDLTKTLFIVSSKSGTTLELSTLYRYFRRRIEQTSSVLPGSHFVAVTDPGSPLERLALADGFRFIAHGLPTVGGRFSALSAFGLLPAAIMGIDGRELLHRALAMHTACSEKNAAANSGVRLGVILGTLAKHGRDKLTVISSTTVQSFGSWLEQLVAESTGKNGRGIIPIDGEHLGETTVYGDDRVFVSIRMRDEDEKAYRSQLAQLAAVGHPVISFTLASPLDLGAELFRWQIATAVAGAILGVNPFDQPDVEAAKTAARRLTDIYRSAGSLPTQPPLLTDGSVQVVATSTSVTGGAEKDLSSVLASHFEQLQAGDYFAILAYLEMSAEVDAPLQRVRHLIRDRHHVATTVGYGPRYLHSTGQLHKGGPRSGVYLLLTADDTEDIDIPGEQVSFGAIKQAQQCGDFEVLSARGRRILHIHLTGSVHDGLTQLEIAVKNAISHN